MEIGVSDAERVNYAESAPGTADVEWHRAFQMIGAHLRDWTSQLACSDTRDSRIRHPQPVDPDEWAQFFTEHVARHSKRAIGAACRKGQGQ